jgi:hypothetical protein
MRERRVVRSDAVVRAHVTTADELGTTRRFQANREEERRRSMPTRLLPWVTVAAFLSLFAAAPAQGALVIEGPELNKNIIRGWDNSGLQMTAKQNITLDSVVYHNQGGADVVELRDSEESVLEDWVIPEANPEYTIYCNCTLLADETYYLVVTDDNNGKYADYQVSNYPEENWHISIDASVGKNRSPEPFWFYFKDITTTPEPTGLGLLALGSVALIRRKR